MAIQQFDLGAVFNTLAQKRAMDIRERAAQQGERMNALQMARLQREDDMGQRQQNALARLSDPNLDDAGKRSVFEQAYPELVAKRLFESGQYAIGADGTVINERTGEVVRTPQILDGEVSAPARTAPAPQRPTTAAGVRGPVPMPVQREELPARRAVPAVFQPTIDMHAERTGLDPRLIGAVFMQESGGRQDVVDGRVVSSAGAEGPMQTMPKTLRDPGYGVPPAQDGSVDEKWRVGTDYLAAMMKKYNGNQILALGAYNWGPGNVDKWIADGADLSKVPAQTKKYIKDILGDDLGLPRQSAEAQQQPGEAPQPEQPASDEGWMRVRNAKSAGLSDAPAGMQWVGKPRAGGGYDFKVMPIPGAPDDRETKAGETSFKEENTLRDEVNNLTKDYRTVTDAYRKIQSASKSQTGAGDMSMLYSYVKLLDPGSVVRESEFATAAASGSFGERVAGAVQKLLTGEKLEDSLRKSFLTEANGIYREQRKGYEAVSEKYKGIARNRKLNPDNVVLDYGADISVPEQEEAKPAVARERGNMAQASEPPMQGARQAPDGNWYVADPNRPGKYLQVQ